MSDTAIEERASLGVYADKRMLRILLLGTMSGFPWVLIGSALSLWLKEDGMSRSTIGFASLIFGVYSINFYWAPLIDRIRIPWLTERVGQRKAWILCLQFIILICLMLWSSLSPAENLWMVIAVGLAIAFSSASQDITIDALRIEQIGKSETGSMAAGAAMAVVGWWTGYKLGGFIALMVADALEVRGYENYWQMTFQILAVLIILMNALLLLIPEVSWRERAAAQAKDQAEVGSAIGGGNGIFSWVGSTVIAPFTSFFRKNGVQVALAILAFIFLFKVGEAFVGKMSIIFYKEVGFSKSDIAIYSKGLGWVVTVVFTLIGGWFAVKQGIVKALFLAGIAMAVTNLMFSWMAWTSEPTLLLFAAAVLVDDVTASIATVIFVTFISLLVDRTYTATQYALLASLGTAGRTVLASSSGAMVDGLDGDWGLFFVITALMVIPSLVVLWMVKDKFTFLEKESKSSE
ncbi:MFS transporter [Granulosicoccus sp.]|nr:MFS transporter [Granulosicoccus sp.]MDB4224190.1 MFS transporter [Granulosicoccus sp.]